MTAAQVRQLLGLLGVAGLMAAGWLLLTWVLIVCRRRWLARRRAQAQALRAANDDLEQDGES